MYQEYTPVTQLQHFCHIIVTIEFDQALPLPFFLIIIVILLLNPKSGGTETPVEPRRPRPCVRNLFRLAHDSMSVPSAVKCSSLVHHSSRAKS
jgi:hypothetical protein